MRLEVSRGRADNSFQILRVQVSIENSYGWPTKLAHEGEKSSKQGARGTITFPKPMTDSYHVSKQRRKRKKEGLKAYLFIIGPVPLSR